MATDADATAGDKQGAVSYTLSAVTNADGNQLTGSDNPFQIDAATGEVRLKQGVTLDREDADNGFIYTLTITAACALTAARRTPRT